MKIVIGLGNPGQNYENTRHNAGSKALDFFKESLSGFSDWQNSEKFKAEISEGEIDGQKIILAKPQTFMNLSGQAVRLLKDFYKIDPSDIIIIHDDIDLMLGDMRLSQNSGSAGHRGAQSVIENLGSQNFGRIRIGIKPQKPPSSFFSIFKRKVYPELGEGAEKFVLQKFSDEEIKIINGVINKSSQALKTILTENFSSAMNKFN